MASHPNSAILLLSQQRLELYFEQGKSRDPHWSVLEVPDSEPAEWVPKLKTELIRLGFKGRSVVVALESDMVKSRRLPMPDVSTRERQEIWSRRAANLLECEPADAVFLSIPLGRGHGRTDDDGEPWMLHAIQRNLIQGIQLELRKVGLPVKRVVLARMSLLARAYELFPDSEGAFLLVAQERRATTISLLRDGGLIQQTVLETDADSNEQATAIALIQELRNFSIYWKRINRGETLENIVMLGFPPSIHQSLVGAVHAALGGVTVTLLPEPDPDVLDTHELELLRSCWVEGPLQPDVQVALPPRALVGLGICTLLAGALFAAGQDFHQDSAEELKQTRSHLQDLHDKSADFDQLVARKENFEHSRDTLEKEVQSWMGVQQSNLPAEQLLPDILESFAGRARLKNMRASSEGDEMQVRLTGVTNGTTDEIYLRLEELRVDLEARPTLTSVSMIPPNRIPDTDDEFTFTVTMEVAPL